MATRKASTVDEGQRGRAESSGWVDRLALLAVEVSTR